MKDDMSTLIVRVPNWVGDVCKALPALDALRQSGFRLHLVGRPWISDLLAGLDLPMSAVGRGIREPARALRDLGYSEGLLLTESFGTAASFRLAGIRAVGFRGDYRSPLLFRAVDRPNDLHEVTAYWHLGREAQRTFAPRTGWLGSEPTRLELPLVDAHRVVADEALTAAGVEAPFTLLGPAAIGTRGGRSKVWPLWRELTRRLHADGVRLVACPGPDEEDTCAATTPEATQIVGLGLGAYGAVCARAKRVVANDSGPLHLAAAVGAEAYGIDLTGEATRRPLGGRFISRHGRWPTVDEVLAALPQDAI